VQKFDVEMLFMIVFVAYRDAPEKNLLTEASPNPVDEI